MKKFTSFITALVCLAFVVGAACGPKKPHKPDPAPGVKHRSDRLHKEIGN